MNKRLFLQLAGLGLALSIGMSPVFAAAPITEQDVIKAEDTWAKDIVEIGKVYQDGGDYKAVASKLIDQLYGYGDGKVLFKPTKAAHDEFRETKAEAMSYFVGGENPEDHGFALQPWSKVRFVNDGINIHSDTADVMGNYIFTDAKTGEEVKAEFSFVYRRAKDGHLVLELHHSSLPFHPPAH